MRGIEWKSTKLQKKCKQCDSICLMKFLRKLFNKSINFSAPEIVILIIKCEDLYCNIQIDANFKTTQPNETFKFPRFFF